MSSDSKKPKKKRAHSVEAFSDDHTTTQGFDSTRVVNLGDGNTIGSGELVPILQFTAGPDQGRILRIVEGKSYLFGRDKSADIQVVDQSCSRNHAEFIFGPDNEIYLRDLGSTNGSIVNKERLKANQPRLLQDGDRIQLGDNTALRYTKATENDADVQMEVYRRATRDPLTNAFNRRRFEEALQRELAFQRRGHQPLGLILFDVDHFKKTNDTYGHLAGDEVLREIGARVPHYVRAEDVFARIGGEEFIVLTRNEDKKGLQILAERLRLGMEEKPVVFEEKSISFTISVGIAHLSPGTQVDRDGFIGYADEALYESKEGGRNRVTMADVEEEKA